MAHGLDIDNVFAFHPPATPETGELHGEVRERCRELAHWLDRSIPQSPEATLAIRKLQETMMFANAAIAIHTPRPVEIPDDAGLTVQLDQTVDGQRPD